MYGKLKKTAYTDSKKADYKPQVDTLENLIYTACYLAYRCYSSGAMKDTELKPIMEKIISDGKSEHDRKHPVLLPAVKEIYTDMRENKNTDFTKYENEHYDQRDWFQIMRIIDFIWEVKGNERDIV